MEKNKTAPIVLDNSGGHYVSVVGDTYRILVSGQESGKDFATIDMLIPPGGGPGPHAHAGMQETFYVVSGEIEFKSELSAFFAQAGSYVFIPKGGMVHQFKNKSNELAHILCTVVPSGLEELFLEIGQPVSPGSFLPPLEMTPERIEQWKAIAKRHGQELYPPDYLD